MDTTPRHARTSAGWWTRLRDAARHLRDLEPVAVQAAARSVFVLAAALGIGIADDVQGQVLAVIAAAYALVETVGAVWARSKVTPTAYAGSTAETVPDGTQTETEAAFDTGVLDVLMQDTDLDPDARSAVKGATLRRPRAFDGT